MRTIVDHWVQIVDVTSVTKGEYCAGIRYGRERPKRAALVNATETVLRSACRQCHVVDLKGTLCPAILPLEALAVLPSPL